MWDEIESTQDHFDLNIIKLRTNRKKIEIQIGEDGIFCEHLWSAIFDVSYTQKITNGRATAVISAVFGDD